MSERRPSAQSAAAFVHKLTGLADRVAALGYAVTRLDCQWMTFGSWRLEIQDGSALDRLAPLPYSPGRPGPDAIEVVWDGREGSLFIRSSPTKQSTALNQWKPVAEIPVGKDKDPVEVACDFIATKLRR